MQKPSEKQLTEVAEWWAVKTFGTPSNNNNGADDIPNFMANSLRNKIGNDERVKTTDEDRENFKQGIIKMLRDEVEQSDFDYDPCFILDAVRINCNVSEMLLPIKTFSKWDATRGCFVAKYQYDSQFEFLSKD